MDLEAASSWSRELTLRELRYFVALADSRSVTAAARAVGLSQPAMSASLANLEQTLGVTLFVRQRGRGVALTPEGQTLASGARQLLVQADALQARSSPVAATPVNLGCLVTVAPLLAPRVLRAYNEVRPDFEFALRVGAQDQLLQLLRTGEIHVALTYDIEVGAAFEFRHLHDATPLALLPADHRLATRPAITLAELVDEPYLLLDLPLSREYFTSLFLTAGLSCEPAMRLADLGLVRSLVANGFGYSLVNLCPRSPETLDGRLVAHVPLVTAVPPLRLGLVALANTTLPQSVLDFVDGVATAGIAEALAATPPPS